MRYYGDGGMNGAQLPINYQLTHLRQGMGGVGLGQLVDWWIYNQPEDSSADWLVGFHVVIHQYNVKLCKLFNY